VPTEPVIPAGAKAAGQDVGGLTLSQAAAVLEERFGATMAAPVEVRTAGKSLRVGPKGLGYEFDALRTARRANIAARASAPFPVDVPLHTTWDGKKLAGFTVKVDRKTDKQARDARLKMSAKRMIVRKAKVGRSIDEAALAGRIEAAIRDPAAVRSFSVKRKRIAAAVSRSDLRKQHSTVVTVDKSSFRLRLFKKLKLVKTYGVATGAPGYETPSGLFSIQNKAVNPAWSAPDRPWAGAYRNEVVPGGAAENPLKARWLGIVGGVGIHGTAAEYSIGSRASHGCLRMRVADVIDLYPRVPVGTPVLIR